MNNLEILDENNDSKMFEVKVPDADTLSAQHGKLHLFQLNTCVLLLNLKYFFPVFASNLALCYNIKN